MKKIKGINKRCRLSVYRSNKSIYAQIIDDRAGKTLVSATSLKIKEGTKTLKATKVGETLAHLALAKKITQVIFDRRDKKYHGRVKALAEAARKSGLNF